MIRINETLSEILTSRVGEIYKIKQAWEKLGLKELVNNAIPFSINNGVLRIAVTHPVWKNEILINKKLLIEKTTKVSGIEIQEIKVEVNSNFFRKHKHDIERRTQKIRKPLQSKDVEEILHQIQSPTIKLRLEKLLKKVT